MLMEISCTYYRNGKRKLLTKLDKNSDLESYWTSVKENFLQKVKDMLVNHGKLKMIYPEIQKNPYQPRKAFDRKIKGIGSVRSKKSRLIQPIIARQSLL